MAGHTDSAAVLSSRPTQSIREYTWPGIEYGEPPSCRFSFFQVSSWPPAAVAVGLLTLTLLTATHLRSMSMRCAWETWSILSIWKPRLGPGGTSIWIVAPELLFTLPSMAGRYLFFCTQDQPTKIQHIAGRCCGFTSTSKLPVRPGCQAWPRLAWAGALRPKASIYMLAAAAPPCQTKRYADALREVPGREAWGSSQPAGQRQGLDASAQSRPPGTPYACATLGSF